MAETPSRLLAGRVILSGMVSLFVGLTLFVIGMFLLERLGNAAGSGFLTAGNIFTSLCLPLVAFGALLRITNPPESKAEGPGADSPEDQP